MVQTPRRWSWGGSLTGHWRLLPIDYAVRNLGRSPLRLALSVGGSALVVLLALIAGAFVQGMARSLIVDITDRNVMLLGSGSEESVERSEIRASVAGIAAASIAGIRQDLDTPYVSPEVHVMAMLHADASDSVDREVLLRGVTATAFMVHQRVSLVEGRAPRAGEDELIVGTLAARRLGLSAEQVAVGRTLYFDDRPWTIVGRFAAPMSVMASEVWMPLSDLMEAMRRETISCVVMTLDSAEFADVDAFAKSRLDLELAALTEAAYYDGLQAFFAPVQVMVWVTAGLIALGGLLGGLNTMYAAFAARVREIGALQTLGYSRRAVVVSLLVESLLAAAGGAIVAAVVALLLLDGLSVNFSMGVFGLLVDAQVLWWGILSGIAVGVIGALPPAWRCLRLPISQALKAA